MVTFWVLSVGGTLVAGLGPKKTTLVMLMGSDGSDMCRLSPWYTDKATASAGVMPSSETGGAEPVVGEPLS